MSGWLEPGKGYNTKRKLNPLQPGERRYAKYAKQERKAAQRRSEVQDERDTEATAEMREAIAAKRASTLREGLDLYADGLYVMEHGVSYGDIETNNCIIKCETHWDACLVLLAYGKEA